MHSKESICSLRRACLALRLPWLLTRSPTSSGGGSCCNAIARMPLETNGSEILVEFLLFRLLSAIGRGWRGVLRHALTMACKCSWLLQQQPPQMFAPNSVITTHTYTT